VAALGTVAALSRGGPAQPDYREALVATHRPVALDPLFAGDDPGARDLSRLLYRRLLHLDNRALPTSDLAATWGTSGDGLEYRFTIGADKRWSDGSRLTVADVAASVALVQVADFPDPHLAAAWKGITTTVGVDSIVFHLSAPRSSFPATISDLPIVPAAGIKGRTTAELKRTATQAMPTSGLYRVAASDSAIVRLQPNPQASMRPSLRSLEFHLVATSDDGIRLLGSGQVDAFTAIDPQQRAAAARIAGVHLHDMLSFRFVDLLFNTRRPGFADPAVRRAIAQAIDRGALVMSALGGAGRTQVGAIPDGVQWIVNRPTEQPDPRLSARALDAAGWTVGTGGVRSRNGEMLAYPLTVPDADPLPEVAAALANQLGKIGVSLTVHPVPVAQFLDQVITPGAFDVAIADWDNGPDPDVSAYWRSNAIPPNGFNVSGLSADPFLDRALDALATEADAALRQAAAEKVNQRLADDAPAVFLYTPTITLAVGEGFNSLNVPAAGLPGDRYAAIDTWRRGPP
jgi:peptide/nickel transport system substrate-binding protein